MESIKDRVAIIGAGCSKFGENWAKSPSDLILEAAYEAYEDAGVDSNDIQAAWFGTWLTGESGQILAAPLKLNYKPITRVENLCATGIDALRNACYAVAAGIYDVVLALGVEKLKDSGWSGLPNYKMQVTNTHRELTPTGAGGFALMASRYFAKYRLSPDEGKRVLAKIAVKNHHNGSLHPKAHFRREITLEQASNAPIIAWPLGLFDCCGVSDGAAAAIITRAELAKKLRADPVYIKALQVCVNTTGNIDPKYDYTHVEETYRAGLAAYAEAGIKNPREEISIAEVHDCFSITELVIYEDLQFSPRGLAKEDVDADTFTLNGKLPVNSDGGLKCFGHPVGASGLRMMYEVYKQLQGKAGERQIRNPKLGLAQALGGDPSQATIGIAIAGL